MNQQIVLLYTGILKNLMYRQNVERNSIFDNVKIKHFQSSLAPRAPTQYVQLKAEGLSRTEFCFCLCIWLLHGPQYQQAGNATDANYEK